MRSRHIACALALVCVFAPLLVAAMSQNAAGNKEDLLVHFWRTLDVNADQQVSAAELYSYFTKVYTHPAKNEQVRG